MKKTIVLIFLLFLTNNAFSSNIVYLDVQYIIDNSDIGKFYKSKIKDTQSENKIKLKSLEEIIKNKEIEIKNKKNILSKEEIDKNIIELNKLVNEYQLKRKKLNDNVLLEKKKYTTNILELLNPLLTNYVDTNNIILVMDKKNVLIGIKSLDITLNILKIINDETKKKNLINEN